MKNCYLTCLLVSSMIPGTLLFSQPPGAEVAEELIYDYTDEGGAYYIQTIIHFSNLGTNPAHAPGLSPFTGYLFPGVTG